MNRIISKNPGLEWVIHPTMPDSTLENLDIKIKIRCLSLVTVNVERSFRLYKHFLGERRLRFNENNICMHMIHMIHYNYFLFKDDDDDDNGSQSEIQSINDE